MILFRVQTAESAYNIYEKSKQIMADGGFNLRKWRSNSQKLCDIISKTEISTDLSTIDRVQQVIQRKDRIVEDVESYAKSSIGFENSNDNQQNVVKILGQNWNIDSDEFFFYFDNLIEYASTLPSTKRSILKVTAKIFDPLGFLSLVTVVIKILFSKLYIDK